MEAQVKTTYIPTSVKQIILRFANKAKEEYFKTEF